jgi:signal transduction histidine kinase
VLAGGFALLTDYVPAVLGQEPPFGFVPGLRQLPMLILLGAFALSMQRYHVFDVGVVLSRSVVYSALVIILTGLYLAVGMIIGYLFQTFSGDVSPLGVTMLLALLITLVALPLRDAIQRGVDRLFLRRRASYRQALQYFSRLLTGPVALPRLLEMIAEQIEELFHPTGLAILLRDRHGYRVVLSWGKLAEEERWQEAAVWREEDEVCRQLAARRQPLYLPWQLENLPADEQKRLRQESASAVQLFVPMHLRNDLAGWFALGSKLSQLGYNREDLDFLSALADQSCVALENARLYNEMKQRATELALLDIVSSAISSSLDLEQVLRTIVESVTKVINCDKSAIFELNEDGRFLNLRMAKGLSPAYIEGSHRIPVRGSNRALALVDRQPLIVPDIDEEPRLDSLADLARVEGFRGVVDVPLAGLEGFLGVLSVYFDQVYRPTPAELEILTTFANQAAIAIENARLYAAATRERDRAQRLYKQTDAALARRVEELTAIEEISRQLASTLDLDKLMHLVLERSLLATEADRAVIALYDAEAGGLQLVAQHGYPATLERYKTELWPHDQGITGRVARTGIPAIVGDISQDPDYAVVADPSRSQLSVPIVHKACVIGIITLESDRAAAFGREHLRFAELLADHAAIGINNARLFTQVMEGRDRLEAILNSTREGVIVLDTTGRIVLTNPRVADLLGERVEEWLWSTPVLNEVGRPASPIFHWTDMGVEELSKALRGENVPQEQAIELAFNLHLAEARRYLEVTATRVVGAAGELMGWVAIVRDMTRQQQLEQFREDLTSMVIHNLQGPLAAVIGSLETLLDLHEMDRGMADQLLAIALDSGRKLYDRIESLLWLRRLEDSQMPLQLEALPLAGVVDGVVEEYMGMAGKAGVELRVWLPHDLPLVMVDGEVIGRVFSNLLDNALKYTPAEGRIEVQARLSEGQSEGSVLCAVTDTGPGIAESVKDAIFGKFHRGQETQTGRRRGMGIGLHYCKLAIEAHGGRIWVESREGEGSTFYFTLPLKNGPLPPAGGSDTA